MLGWLIVAALAAPVPSPGRAVLRQVAFADWRAFAVDAGSAGVNGASAKATQKALTHDMDKARKKLGHHDAAPPPAASTKTSASEEKQLDQDMQRAKRHLGEASGASAAPARPTSAGSATATVPPAPSSPPPVPLPAYPPPPPPFVGWHQHHHHRWHHRRRWHLRPAWYQTPLFDGHSRGYYTAWGVVDWALAGGSWIGTLVSAVVAGSLLSVGTQDYPLTLRQQDPTGRLDPSAPDFAARRWTKSDYRMAGAAVGVLSIALGATGAVACWRAQTNLARARDLRDQERAELLPYWQRHGWEK